MPVLEETFVFASSEVHDVCAIRMDRHGSRDAVSRRTILAVARRMGASFAAVVILFHQMIPRTESDQLRVICRRRDGYGARATNVSMTQLVRQLLEFVGRE